MTLPLLLLLLDAATVVAPASSDCLQSDRQEIVVCRRVIAPDRYRLPLPRADPPTGPPRADWGLGHGIRAGIAASQQAMPQGAVSQRVMAMVKIPF